MIKTTVALKPKIFTVQSFTEKKKKKIANAHARGTCSSYLLGALVSPCQIWEEFLT